MSFLLTRLNTFSLQFSKQTDSKLKYDTETTDYLTIVSNITQHTFNLLFDIPIVKNNKIERIVSTLQISCDFEQDTIKQINVSIIDIEYHQIMWKYNNFYNKFDTKTILIDKNTYKNDFKNSLIIELLDNSVIVKACQYIKETNTQNDINTNTIHDGVYNIITYYTYQFDSVDIKFMNTINMKVTNNVIHIINVLLKPCDVVFKHS